MTFGQKGSGNGSASGWSFREMVMETTAIDVDPKEPRMWPPFMAP